MKNAISHAKPPLVIQLIPTLGLGGAERVVVDLARELPAHGFRSMVISMMGGGALSQDLEDAHVPHVILPRRRNRWQMIKEVQRLLEHEKPTIVHTHLSGADLWGSIAAERANVPCIVTTEHNTVEGTGKLVAWLRHTRLRKHDVIVAVSGAVRETLLARDPALRSRMMTIRNGIDLSRLVMRSDMPFHVTPRLVAVGRLEPQKGYEILFAALANVDRRWALMIVGTGSLETHLRRLAGRLGIASRITWMGNRMDVPHILSVSDLCCFPSRFEGNGLVAAEAASSAVPLIASDLPVLHEFLEENEVDFVSMGDVPAWTKAIREALDSSDDRRRRAVCVAPLVRARVSLDTMVGEYAELYRVLVGE